MPPDMSALASQFFAALIEEARKEPVDAAAEQVPPASAAASGASSQVLLKATLHLDQDAPAQYTTWTLTLDKGRLLGVESATAASAPSPVMTAVPWVEIAASTLELLLTKQVNPLAAFARGAFRFARAAEVDGGALLQDW
jgi:hypothetical protein